MTTQPQLTAAAALALHAQVWSDWVAKRVSLAELAASRTRAILAGASENEIGRIEGRGGRTTQ